MKKIILILPLFLLLLNCSQEDDEQIHADDLAEIEQYLADQNLTAESTDTGLHYIIEEEGNGQFPSSFSTVRCSYLGYLTDGTVFDGSGDATFSLGSVIQGWREGIPLISKGGSAKLIVPSRLGYGERGSGELIPENTVLVFDVTLIDFQ